MNIFNRIAKNVKIKIPNLIKAVYVVFKEDIVLVKWAQRRDSKKNFGDDLNPWLVEKLTGKEVINGARIFNFTNKKIYSVIGSILGGSKTKKMIVWGSGFIDDNDPIKVTPKKVLAVRGPLTRNKMLEQGIECPEIYGDPALLLPKFYNPEIRKKYKLGIIAHYIDKNTSNYKQFVNKFPDDILIIDIEDSIENVVNNILECKKIASSSLHGIIVADAYKIPSIQVKFSNNIVGGSFKFKDYMGGVNREYREPLIIKENTSLDTVLNSFYNYSIDFDLDKLLEVCPFNKEGY